MASGKVNFNDFIKLRDKLQRLNDEAKRQEFLESCAKELAARLLAKVKKRTPVGDYSGASYTCESGHTHKGAKVPGKVGGTLRRRWAIEPIRKEGDKYIIEIINPVEYAPYVEYGHRTRGGKGWVEGHFMMTISENEIRDMAPSILEKKLRRQLGDLLK
ncbi:MAG: HK97 gp10 family phage protein [Lachnospiraceae bacterium]|nr:HK97 gp10 family phage protein [Lachnospiraceae bacterium]